jgi:hypothetical protein
LLRIRTIEQHNLLALNVNLVTPSSGKFNDLMNGWKTDPPTRRVFCRAGRMAGMKFRLATLFWLIACCGLLWVSLITAPYFFERYRLVNLVTAEEHSLRPVELVGRFALCAATFLLGLWFMQNRRRR